MIITRSPSRISLGGGGTDLSSYYRQHGGFVIAAAIDKYVYITLHQTFVEEAIIKYSQTERVKRIEDIHHPLVREALLLTGVPPEGLEIASMSDIPAGTGLEFLWLFHNCAAAGVAHAQEDDRAEARTCRAGLPRRNRSCAGTGGEAGPVHCRLRGHYLF